MKKDKKLSVEETRRLFSVAYATVIIWAVTVTFSRVGGGKLFLVLSWISFAAALICFVLHAVKLSFPSFLKLGGMLILIAAFWGLVYWMMTMLGGAIWVLSLVVIVFALTMIYYLLIRLYGLQDLF